MSDINPISFRPESEAQKQQIVSQARKQDETVTEYCRMAIEQRIARETESERVDELEVESRLDEVTTAFTEEIAAAMEVNTQQELVYEIALWELLCKGYSESECRKAMEVAPAKFDREMENMIEKEGGDS